MSHPISRSSSNTHTAIATQLTNPSTTLQCFFAPPVQTFCLRSSPWMTSDFSAGPAPTSTASRPSTRTRCTSRGKKLTTCLEEPMRLKTPMRPQCSAQTCAAVGANAPTSWRSRLGRATSQPRSFTVAASAATSGRTTEAAAHAIFIHFSLYFVS